MNESEPYSEPMPEYKVHDDHYEASKNKLIFDESMKMILTYGHNTVLIQTAIISQAAVSIIFSIKGESDRYVGGFMAWQRLSTTTTRMEFESHE